MRPSDGSSGLRILILSATFPPTRCGVGDYARRLALEIAANGHEVFVLTGTGEDPEHQHGESDDTVAVNPPPIARPETAPRFEPIADGLAVARAIESWDWTCLDVVRASLEAVRPDVLSLQYHGEDYLLHPAVCHVPEVAAATSVPTALTLHNLQRSRAWEGGDDPFETMLATSDVWICTNTLDEAELRLRTRANQPGRLHVIAPGPCITTNHDRSPRSAGPFEVAYFGFLNPQKGLEYLLRATARLLAEGRDLRLVLAAGVHTDAPGRLRDYGDFIEREIDRLSLRDRIDWRGYLPESEVSGLLTGCHLGVFPFRDGLSGKNSSFWSVLHHATPALTTSGAGLPAGLKDGENVLLARPRDAEDLAARMGWAMDHRVSLAEVGESGRRYVEDLLGWSKLAESTARAFGATLGQAGKVAGA